MGCENAGDIAAEAEEGGMAEGEEPAEAEREVEPDGGKRQHERGDGAYEHVCDA